VIKNDQNVDSSLRSLIYETWETHKELKAAFSSGSMSEFSNVPKKMNALTEYGKKMKYYVR